MSKTISLDEATRTQIILGAVNAAGPTDGDLAGWSARVKENAKTIALMIAPGSQPNRAIDQILGCKVFRATVVKIVKEKSSTRGKVTLAVTPTDRSPDGIEYVRTERTDNAEGTAMAQTIYRLVGHRVLLWVELEETANGRKVRVVRHVEDLGPDPEYATDSEE